MIQINLDAARAFAVEATSRLQSGAIEDVLRHLLSANLPLMFPDNPWWIREHSTGAEANVHYIDAAGLRRSGFVDSLVGKTAIEYEKNLNIRSVYDEGYHQVEEYCSALLNNGVFFDDIVGVLSDTVHWYAFSVSIESEPATSETYGPGNISLREIDTVNLEDHSDANLNRFGLFVNRYLGREGSRQLNALSLTADMGIYSTFCAVHIARLKGMVDEAFSARAHYGEMIKSLWQNFVIRFEGDGSHRFNRNSYTNELYIMTLAKLLCANILKGSVVDDSPREIEGIINGRWFKERGFVNLVEYDYFGWLSEPPFIEKIIEIARDMQGDLSAYDYRDIVTEDLFGSLVAQLADKDRRILLGQEFTPQWVAQKIVARAIELLPEMELPNFVDMCCGSGVFVVETIKQTKARLRIASPTQCSEETLGALLNSVVGFDIDPLSVLLAKLNWAMAMREFAQFVRVDMMIPIYHADSIFATAPLTRMLDRNYETQNILMLFDGEQVLLPGFLISPKNRRLFDSYIQMCYEIAKIRSRGDCIEYSHNQAEEFVTRLVSDAGIDLDETQTDALFDSCQKLITTLEKLQREGRNGIWPFLLGNSYRPGLVKGQFNAVVSNPPWMAMSKLADNPYRNDIVLRAERYGIKPTGSSHLHAELATVFFLNSVDKYLKDGCFCGVVLPDTLLNGYHHEPFRKQLYLNSEWPVDFKVDEIWELPTNTFKNKAVVLFGQKTRIANPDVIAGKRIFSDMNDEQIAYRILRQGHRTAWSSNPTAQNITEGVLESIPFLQGADIMPRTLVFHKAVQQPNGKWSLQPIPRQHDELSYLVCDAKKYADFSLETLNVDGQFLYDCYMSNHLLPFLLNPPAKAFLPMKREDGVLKAMAESDIAAFGTTSYAAFERIFIETNENASQYFERINYRNKLNPQNFSSTSDNEYLVLAGAGGGYTCAAYISMSSVSKEKTIIDQTLYWYVAKSEDEALYITALLNSNALDAIIADFQPEGAMGRRHVHKLPYAVTPRFNAEDTSHMLVVEKVRALTERLRSGISDSGIAQYLSPSQSSLAIRRRKLRDYIHDLPENVACENACREVYGL
jgi:methylase of polypeptide subunit release factors